MGKLLRKNKTTALLLITVILGAAVFYCAFFQKLKPVQALGNIYYVDNTATGCSMPSDNDYNPVTGKCGSGSSTVYNTLSNANAAVSGGNTIDVRAGTYSGGITITGKSGTAGNYTIFQAHPGETVTLVDAYDAFYGIDVSYLKIIGFEITSYSHGAVVIGGSGSHVEIRNNTIHHSKTTAADAIEISAGKYLGLQPVGNDCWYDYEHAYTDIIIDGNYLHDITVGGGEGINILFDIQRFQITNNRLSNIPDIGIDVIGRTYVNFCNRNSYYNRCTAYCGYIDPNFPTTDNKYTRNGIISGNILTTVGPGSTTSASSIYVDGGRDIIIENNVVIDGLFGVTVSTEDTHGKSEGIIVRRNKLISCAYGINLEGNNADAPTYRGHSDDCRIVHNTIAATVGYPAMYPPYAPGGDWTQVYVDNSHRNTFKNNIFYCPYSAGYSNHQLMSPLHDNVRPQDYNVSDLTFNFNNWYIGGTRSGYFSYIGTDYNTFSAFQAGTGQEANGISLNPEFKDLALSHSVAPTYFDHHDVTLKSTSGCIDAGSPLTTTRTAGSNTTTLNVNDARYFHDGYGITGVVGDSIKVGNNNIVTVTDVDYTTNVVQVDSPISYNIGDPVSYPYFGAKPDIGAFEFQSAPITYLKPDLNQDKTINLSDFNLFKSYFQTQNTLADFNNDSKTNTQDLGIMMGVWGAY